MLYGHLWYFSYFLFYLTKNLLYSFIVISIIFSYGIEISQLYHAPWIDSIRATTLGGLILGFGFLWSDLICYTVGIVIGAIIDKFINN